MADDEWTPRQCGARSAGALELDDCHAKLKEIASAPIPGADRRFIILVNNDTEESTAPRPR